jgi:hypothetical protein
MQRRSVKGRSGVGLLGFAVIAMSLFIVVIVVAVLFGRQLGAIEAGLALR